MNMSVTVSYFSHKLCQLLINSKFEMFLAEVSMSSKEFYSPGSFFKILDKTVISVQRYGSFLFFTLFQILKVKCLQQLSAEFMYVSNLSLTYEIY